jgi:hypothetical protein
MDLVYGIDTIRTQTALLRLSYCMYLNSWTVFECNGYLYKTLFTVSNHAETRKEHSTTTTTKVSRATLGKC